MAVTADSVVVELIARTDGYTNAIRSAGAATDTAMSNIERSAGKAEASIQRFANENVRSAGAIANANRNLGRQIADIGTQVAGGQSPFLILAQQAPQVADALADTGGKAAQVASFFAGPWGAALLAAGSALGVLLGKALETGDGVEDLVAKLTEQAAKAELSAQADRVFAGTQAGLYARINETTKALAAQNATLRTNAQLRNVQAQSENIAAQANASRAAAAVDAARRDVQRTFQQGGTRGEIGSERAIARQREAQTALTQAQEKARQANVSLNVSRVFLAAENALANSTAQGRVAKQFDDRIAAVKRAAVAEANAGRQIGTATQQRIEQLEREKAAALETASARERVTSGGRTRAGGGRSAVRSRAMSSAAVEPFVFSAEYINNEAAFARLQEDAKKAGERAAQAFREVFGREGTDYENPFAGVADYDRSIEREGQARREVNQQLAREQEDQIYGLANLYERAFTGGTRGFLDEFKREGLRTVALILAQLAVGKSLSAALGSSGGGASALGSIFAALGGRASGGYVGPNQTVRVNEGRSNGVELLRMGPQGGTVIPLGQTRAQPRGGGTTVLQTIQVDARGAVMNDAFARDILARAGQDARQVVSSNNGAIRKGLPAAQARFDQLGTT